MITVKQARKILGKASENVPEDELLKEIESASLLKDLFFKIYLEGKTARQKSLTNHVKSQ